jgi:hypothetical protein
MVRRWSLIGYFPTLHPTSPTAAQLQLRQRDGRVGGKGIEKQRQLSAPERGPNREVRSRNVKLIWMLSDRETVVELPFAADRCPCVVEAANRVTGTCWYQRRCGAVGVHLKVASSGAWVRAVTSLHALSTLELRGCDELAASWRAGAGP